MLGGFHRTTFQAPITLKISARSHFGAKLCYPGYPSARLEPAAVPQGRWH